MKLVRMFVLGVTTVGLLGLVAVPSASADRVRVVRSLADFPYHMPPAPGGFAFESCDPGYQGPRHLASDPVIERGPLPVPLGSRTWGFDSTEQLAIGPWWRIESGSIAATSQMQMQVYSDSGTARGVALATVYADDGLNSLWHGAAPLSVSAGSWQTVHVTSGTSYTWRGPDGAEFTGSISDMLAHIGGGDPPVSVGLGFGCDPEAGMFHFDDARIDRAGDVETLDFEGATTRTSIAATPGTVTAGGATHIVGVLAPDGIASGSLVLQRRAFGSHTWRKVVERPPAVDAHTGQLTVTYATRPLRRTSYRWLYPGNGAADGSASKVLPVMVRTAVRARAPHRATLRSTVRVTGSTRPSKPGQRVSLWHGDHLVAAGKVSAKGTFALRARATFRGVLTLVVKIGNSEGNLRGRSRMLTVRVR